MCIRDRDKPLGKYYRLNLDLDDLKKAKNPRMTQTATERVPLLSTWCDRRRETFVNLDLFQTTTTVLLIVPNFVSCHVFS